MLNEEEIRSLIVLRVKKAASAGTFNETYRIEARVRELIGVLTGEKAQDSDGYTPDYLDAAQIPYIMNEDGSFSWVKEWLLNHRFMLDPEDEDSLKHPKFGDW